MLDQTVHEHCQHEGEHAADEDAVFEDVHHDLHVGHEARLLGEPNRRIRPDRSAEFESVAMVLK